MEPPHRHHPVASSVARPPPTVTVDGVVCHASPRDDGRAAVGYDYRRGLVVRAAFEGARGWVTRPREEGGPATPEETAAAFFPGASHAGFEPPFVVRDASGAVFAALFKKAGALAAAVALGTYNDRRRVHFARLGGPVVRAPTTRWLHVGGERDFFARVEREVWNAFEPGACPFNLDQAALPPGVPYIVFHGGEKMVFPHTYAPFSTAGSLEVHVRGSQAHQRRLVRVAPGPFDLLAVVEAPQRSASRKPGHAVVAHPNAFTAAEHHRINHGYGIVSSRPVEVYGIDLDDGAGLAAWTRWWTRGDDGKEGGRWSQLVPTGSPLGTWGWRRSGPPSVAARQHALPAEPAVHAGVGVYNELADAYFAEA